MFEEKDKKVILNLLKNLKIPNSIENDKIFLIWNLSSIKMYFLLDEFIIFLKKVVLKYLSNLNES